MKPRLLSVVGTLLSALLAPAAALAWGVEGHHMVAELAEPLLTTATRAELARLLQLEPGATLTTLSTWADENRSPGTASWHYVNLPRDSNCQYDAARDCPGGQCVVDAIEAQAAVLASNAADAQRLQALKYVVHFVADAHQPLHAGYADDKGGNTYQLQAFGRATNLHALWDSGLITHWPDGPASLRAHIATTLGQMASSEAGTPMMWVQESCRVVATDGFYPVSHKMAPDYPETVAPILVERLGAAARRLAAVLNRSLGTSK